MSTTSATAASSIPAAYTAVAKGYETAFNAGDAAGLASLFTDDCLSLPPAGPELSGSTAIRDFYQPMFDHFRGELSIQPREAIMQGDTCIASGDWKSVFTPKAGGEAFTIEGKYLNCLRVLPDGSMKIFRHVWNMPGPMPAELMPR